MLYYAPILLKNYPDLLKPYKNLQNLVVKKRHTFLKKKFATFHHSLEGAKYGLKGTDGIKTGSGLKKASITHQPLNVKILDL